MSLMVTAEGLILGKEYAGDEENDEGDSGNTRRQTSLTK